MKRISFSRMELEFYFIKNAESWQDGFIYFLGEPRLGDDDVRCRWCRYKDKRGVDLISDVLPFGRPWYGEPNAIANAIGYAKFRSRSHDAVIRVYNESGNVIETYEHAGDFKE